MKWFAFAVRQKNEQHNSQKLFKLPISFNNEQLANKTNNSRFRALEFAKSIKKPKVTSSPEKTTDREFEEDMKERDRIYDRLPMYKKEFKIWGRKNQNVL